MKIVLPALRRGIFAAAFCAPLSSGEAQGYSQSYNPPPAAFAPPSGLRPIDQSPRDSLPLYRPGIWEGFYFGGYLGGETVAPSLQYFDLDRMRGMVGGLHAGYNLQYRNMVGGLELDAGTSGAGISGPVSTSVRGELAHDWLASLRIRAGYAAGPMLVFGTAGYAVTSFTTQLSSGRYSVSSDTTMNGIVVGGGIEMKFSPRISGRIEALHYHYFDKVLATAPGASVSAGGHSDTIRAGLSYHFN